jgi:LL-diaminopimelate aminotransferase
MSFQSKKVAEIPPYLFAEIKKKKERMVKEGIDVIDLGMGDPDLPTPEHIVNKMIEEIRDPKNLKYPSFNGDIEFRQAVVNFYKRQYNVKLDPETEVLALIGSKEGIAHLIPSIVDPDDYVMIPDPGYPVYQRATHLAGAIPYLMSTTAESNFQPVFKDIPANIVDKTKLMILNFPGNPTAETIDIGFYESALKYAKDNNFAVVNDSAYNMVTFDNYVAPSILQAEGAKEIAVEFGSLSKTYNMTGFRIGYVVGNKDIIKSLTVYKSNTDTGVFVPIQKAAAFALNSDQSCVQKHNLVYKDRLETMVKSLNSIGIDAKVPKATFFVWSPVPKGYTSSSFANEVLEQTGVIITPGTLFGPSGEGYFRISVSVPNERLNEAVSRIKKKMSVKVK